MPHITNNGVRLEYETYGSGEPVLLVHGMFCCKDTLEASGFVEELLDRYLVIIVDLRGHGYSDKPEGSDSYNMGLFVSDIIAILDYLGIDKVHYYGYSLGGWVGLGMLKFASQRLLSLAVGSAQPFDEWWLMNCSYWLNEYLKHGDDTLKIAKRMFTTTIENLADIDKFKERIELMLRNVNQLNENVLSAVISLSRNLEELQLSSSLINSNIPSLFFGGDLDSNNWVGYERILRQTREDIRMITLQGSYAELNFDYREILPVLTEFWSKL